MIKVIKIMFGVLMFASVANANVFVNWFSSGGFVWDSTPTVGFLGDGTGNSALAQLIWSSDNVIDAVDIGDANYVSGNDTLLTSVVITEDGVAGNFDEYSVQTYNPGFDDGGVQPNGGFIYARLFQDNSVGVGDWYYNGSILAASDLNPAAVPAPTAQPYDMTQPGEYSHLGADMNAIDGAFSFQVVPEPGTMGLLALGLVTLGGAARRRRKAAVEA